MKENKQANRSKRWMFESLMDLMEKTPFKSISISNIVEKADVARLTFYRNFKTKEDIVLYKIDEIIQNMNKILDSIENIEKEQALVFISNELLNHEIFINALIKNDLDYLMIKSFKTEVSDLLQRVLGISDEYKLSFYVGGFATVIIEWFKEKKSKKPLEEVLLGLI